MRSSARNTTAIGNDLYSKILLLSVGMFGFFAGTLLTLHTGLGNCDLVVHRNDVMLHRNSGGDGGGGVEVEKLVQQKIQELQKSLPKCTTTDENISNNNNNKRIDKIEKPQLTSPMKFPVTTGKWANGMARINKLQFHDYLDTGVPIDLPRGEDSDVLLLYGPKSTLPDGWDTMKSGIPQIQPQEAMVNCNHVNIILTSPDKLRNQCIAIMPQYESFHIQKWMRVAKHPEMKKQTGGIDPDAPLTPVSRGLAPNGRGQFLAPDSNQISKNWALLSKYFDSYKQSLDALRPLAKKVATKKNTVTVMLSNWGQSELLTNFACSAKSRDLDISSVLVFATDPETKELAESLGLTAFYDETNFGEMPVEAAHHYGDRKFTAMMMAKVICVQMVSALGYNILFQDVDIVWYKNPIQYFENNLSEFDMLFQDDGGHTVRYAPYSANSGFYYVRHNRRTEYFFACLLLAGDVILETDSHQQALIALMGEHVSLYGLRVKIFSRDEDDFPGGYHYHQKTGKYLRAYFRGEKHPYIFHMSWTNNKDNKLLFFQQMGDWYVHEQCVHKKVNEIDGLDDPSSNYVQSCCSAEPIIKCHYRDKPSKIPCKDSPAIDAGKPSWWKD